MRTHQVLGSVAALIIVVTATTYADSAETGTSADVDPTAAEDQGDGSPDPLEIARSSAAFLAGQPAMAFDWFVTFDEVIEGREKITYIRSGFTVMDREQGFYSRTERGDNIRDYYYDGNTFTVVGPYEGFYSSAPFDAGFDALLDAARQRTDKPLVVWSIMSPTLGEDPVANVEGAAYLGTTLFAGEEAYHLAFSEYDEDWQIFISTDPDRPVPLLIVSTDPYSQGWPQYYAYFLNWNFDPEIAEGAFSYVPAEDDVPVTMPNLQIPDEPSQGSQ